MTRILVDFPDSVIPGFVLERSRLHGKFDVHYGTYYGEPAVLRLRPVAFLQKSLPAVLTRFVYQGFRLQISTILAQGEFPDTFWHIERYIGETWSCAHTSQNPPTWLDASEFDVMAKLFWQLQPFWEEVVPNDAMHIRDPLFRMKYWFAQAHDVFSGLDESLRTKALVLWDRAYEVTAPLVQSTVGNIFSGVPLIACHGHLFSTHIAIAKDSPGVIGLCEFDKLGRYIFGYDVVMELWYRWMRMPAAELSNEELVERLAGEQGYLARMLERCPRECPHNYTTMLHWLRVALYTRLVGSLLDIANRMKRAHSGEHDVHHCFASTEEEQHRLSVIVDAIEMMSRRYFC